MLLMVPTVASIDTSYLLVGRTVTVTPLQVSIRMNTKRLGRRTGGSGHYNLLITGILGQHPDVSNSRQPHKLGRFHKPTATCGRFGR